MFVLVLDRVSGCGMCAESFRDAFVHLREPDVARISEHLGTFGSLCYLYIYTHIHTRHNTMKYHIVVTKVNHEKLL